MLHVLEDAYDLPAFVQQVNIWILCRYTCIPTPHGALGYVILDFNFEIFVFGFWESARLITLVFQLYWPYFLTFNLLLVFHLYLIRKGLKKKKLEIANKLAIISGTNELGPVKFVERRYFLEVSIFFSRFICSNISVYMCMNYSKKLAKFLFDVDFMDFFFLLTK